MTTYTQRKRSVVKAITFRAIVLMSDFLIVYLITHRVDTSLGLVILTNLASTTLYYLHERFWSGIKWGRVPEHVNEPVKIPE
jgi:adenylylsulfate kinase